ncbi:hypothetical protein VTL71DRAFT_7864 [Oculimacula yallundae]|uniref:Uncharacterized protein n=1 Tax=Oculimacula yallundae TaxID=86028 RepID=A0ABR4CY79_9HELO
MREMEPLVPLVKPPYIQYNRFAFPVAMPCSYFLSCIPVSNQFSTDFLFRFCRFLSFSGGHLLVLSSVERIFQFFPATTFYTNSQRQFTLVRANSPPNSKVKVCIEVNFLPYQPAYNLHIYQSDFCPIPSRHFIMGQAFSGPDAFKFIGFTPEATAVLQRQPMLLVLLVLVLFSMIGLGLLAYYIHVVTNRPYAKPKPAKGAAKK